MTKGGCSLLLNFDAAHSLGSVMAETTPMRSNVDFLFERWTDLQS